MLFVLSPAKSLDFDLPMPDGITASEPHFLGEAERLVSVLRTQTPAQIAGMMHLSDDLAQRNVDRYGRWRPDAVGNQSRPAIYAFDGDVYRGLQASRFSVDDALWAQQHLAILSGLYGVLRPLDRLQPYRLEMGTRLATSRGADLYAHWGDTLAQHLNALAARDVSPVVVNLASQEYFMSVDRSVLKPRVIDCVFEDHSGGRYKVLGLYAKRARGLMARYAVQRRITTPAGLRGFAGEGYRHDPAVSTPDRMVFRRHKGGGGSMAAPAVGREAT